jgi:hypothetical protein
MDSAQRIIGQSNQQKLVLYSTTGENGQGKAAPAQQQ